MLDLKFVVWVAVVYSLPLHCTGRCLFGNSDYCFFKCHCDQSGQCNDEEVTCPGGCASDILGYKWMGPACQIGNLAFKKTAKHYGNSQDILRDDPNNAVDGLLEPSCTDISTFKDTLAQWGVDLGYQCRVLNITIHFPKVPKGGGIEKYRNHFLIRVSNTDPASDPGVVCIKANSDSIPPPTYTISCPDNTIGRYVYFSRLSEGYEPHRATLCEVIVIGYKKIDCSRCPYIGDCSDVTGCKTCSGSYKPDCKEVCEEGIYGTNCQQKCGKCRNNIVCNKISGACPLGCQQWWATDLCQTFINAPQGTNKSLSILTGDDTSLTLVWVQITVDKDIGRFYGYEIRHKISNDTQFVKEVVNIVRHQVGSSTNKITIKDLVANTWYDVIIYPYREWSDKKDYGSPYETVTGQTKCTNPANPVLTSVTRLPANDNETGMIKVTFQDVQTLYSGCDILSKVWLRYRIENKEFSIEQNLTSQTASFESQYDGNYLVWLTVDNNAGLSSSSDTWTLGDNAAIIRTKPKVLQKEIIISTFIVFFCLILLVIIIVYCVKRKRHKLWNKRTNDTNSQNEDDLEVEMIDVTGHVIEGRLPQFPPRRKKLSSVGDTGISNGVYQNFELEPIKDVNMEDFEDYVNRRMDTDQFVEEYASLPPAEPDKCGIAMSEANIKCNRYRKIYPYNETRVILQTADTMQQDFINANYITGYRKPNEYIATQGPFDTTVVEFWRMIWQEDSNRIVMVANIEESGKIRCSQYWPTQIGLPVTHGPFTVITEREDITVDYTTRMITVKKNDDIRTVYHLHFTSWTDKRKPVYGATTLIAFYRNVHSLHEVAKGPLVVHCSAGIGRTGTFIALDILQKQTMHKGILNVYNCVKKLRSERMLMVQTEAQYHFIHMFMVEFIKCGFTSYDVNGFPNTFRLLCDPDPQLAGLSRLERQFQILCEMKDKLIDNQLKDGLLNYNRPKNRDLDVVPTDCDRPRLPGKVKDDYINAVYVDSFKVRDFYVVTQMPLPETITDFWRLVYKLKTRSIIMLNQFDNTDPTSKPYWPSKEIPNQSYGPIELTLVSTNNDNTTDSVYTRDFLIRSKNSKRTEGRTLRHFQLLTWPNSATVPPTKEDLFKLIDLNGQWQDQLKSKRAGNTIVHCLTGGRQSGVYCGITFLLDKMSSEQQIDGFLAARYVTRTRPQFFQTKEEFRFLHEVALAIIPKNKLYENIPQTL